MGEEVLAHLLSNVGVPAALCFYVLFGVSKTLKELTNAINRQTDEMDKRLDKIENKTNELSLEVKALQRKE